MTLRPIALACALALAATQASAEDLTVGITTTGVPFTFVDTATQEPTGAMVDLAAAVAEDIGRDPKMAVNQFSALIPALTTGRIDIISAGMFATDKRREVVEFSIPVYSYGDAAFVAAENAGTYTLEDFAGEVVGAQIGTTFADKLQEMGIFKEVKLYESLVDIMRDVKLGRIKAGIGDKPIVAYQIAQTPALGVVLAEGYTPMTEGQVAMAVSKDDPALLEAVNASLSAMADSGELAAIFAKYGL